MNPAPSLYSSIFKKNNSYIINTKNQLEFRIKYSLNKAKALNKGEGAG